MCTDMPVKMKSTRPTKSNKKQDTLQTEDVQVFTGLPPKVEGQLRHYVKLCITQIIWTTPKPPSICHVRVQWWGEEGQGALFKPANVKKTDKASTRTIARYAIRSGPKQFAAYLKDMPSLRLDILSGPLMLPIAVVNIEEIGLLALNRPINGFFSAFSELQEKVAELQVSIIMESLMSSFDSSSTIPTPDHSIDMYNSDVYNLPATRIIPTPQPTSSIYTSADDPFNSPAPNKGSSLRIPLRGSEQSADPTSSQSTDIAQTLADIRSNAQDALYMESAAQPSAVQLNDTLMRRVVFNGKDTLDSIPSLPQDSSKSDGKPVPYHDDMVAALLERGTRLRNAMVSLSDSAQSGEHTSQSGGSVTDPLNSARSNVQVKDKRHGRAPSGLLDELMNTSYRHSGDIDTLGASLDVDSAAVDLVMSSAFTDEQIKMAHALGGNSSSSSISLNGDDDMYSDTADPIHDDTIINELFYKHSDDDISDIGLFSDDDTLKATLEQSTPTAEIKRLRRPRQPSVSSIDEPGNMRPSSRSSNNSLIIDEVLNQKATTPKKTTKRTTERGRKKIKKKRSGSKSKSKSRSRSRSQSSTRQGEGRSTVDRSDVSSILSVSSYPLQERHTPRNHSRERSRERSRDRSLSPQQVDGLSIERLTLLGRVHVARVVVDQLLLADNVRTPTKSKSASKGKPPRPASAKSTYFIEYQFPVVAPSKDKYSGTAVGNEVMRVASKKVTNDVVKFGHRSVFPIQFDGQVIEKWWQSALVFKVYARSPSQKVPHLLGMCNVSLKSILKSDTLYLDRVYDVKDRTQGDLNTSVTTKPWPVLGKLQLSVELASDSKDFSTALAKTRLAEMGKHRVIPIVQKKSLTKKGKEMVDKAQRKKQHHIGENLCSGTQTEPVTANIDRIHYEVPHDLGSRSQFVPCQTPHDYQYGSSSQPMQIVAVPATESAIEALTLHTLLLITEGQSVMLSGTQPLTLDSSKPLQHPTSTPRDSCARNLYLTCRMLWSDDDCRSQVCWGTANPQFQLSQVAPVLLTSSLLERLRNNFMVVEVWDKKTTSENDQLVGMVKLPLHQFYMSYRDRRIANSLMKSQFPVISVDSFLPIMNPFSGTQHGQLKVLLALGSAEQVNSLQKIKLNSDSAEIAPERPLHNLERQQVFIEGKGMTDYTVTDNIVEHIFEVCVDGVKSLMPLENMIWGEADCFIQYHFPVHTQTKQKGTICVQQVPSMKTFRTSTTLCVPDPVFSEVLRHRILLSEGIPVQREILTACAGAGGKVGGIVFEVWCRFYHPNVRDQVIAKGTLPLAKLCAMVTMKRRGEANIQTFSLPLSPHNGNSDDVEHTAKLQESGLLDVTIQYKTAISKNENGVDVVSKSSPGAQVCISVSIIRATGLKAAAVSLARQDAGMQYVSEVGVNSYAKVKLSFLSKEDERLTRTVARSFSPEFCYHLDFPCPLLWSDADSDALSLAEILEHAEASFEIWHQVPTSTFESDRHYTSQTHDIGPSGKRLVQYGGDVLLGTVTVPLKSLLAKKTGISGWYGVNLPSSGWEKPEQVVYNQETDSHSPEAQGGSRGLDRLVGGLEIAIKFAHQEDLDRVLHAARGIGWAPDFDTRDFERSDNEDSENSSCQVTIRVDAVCFPLNSALSVTQINDEQQTPLIHAYIRYKFYDKGAVVSPLFTVEESSPDYLSADISYKKQITISNTAPLNWYLNEEKLEVQIWSTQHADSKDKKRPRHRDKLIGSSYIPLEKLTNTARRTRTVSGVYALYKPGVATLGGACVRCYVTLQQNQLSSVSDNDSTSDLEHFSPLRSTHPHNKHEIPVQDTQTIDLTNTFPVTISIERALHLPYVQAEQDSSAQDAPCPYVSYQTAYGPELHCTGIVDRNCNPMWNHSEDTRLEKILLTETNKNLVFKVWHNVNSASSVPDKSTDKVLGFVSVDIAPLLAGFTQLAGWYNIMDFHGQCQGQIKVCITPSEPIIGMKTTKLNTETSILPAPSAAMTSFVWPVSGLHHFSQHYDNVKSYHETLQQTKPALAESRQPAAPQSSVPPSASVSASSRSVLFNNLRSNMNELDEITQKLKQRLQTPVDVHRGDKQDSDPSVQHSDEAVQLTDSSRTNGTEDFTNITSTSQTNTSDTRHHGNRTQQPSQHHDSVQPLSDNHDDPSYVPKSADILQQALTNTLQGSRLDDGVSTLLQQLQSLQLLNTQTTTDSSEQRISDMFRSTLDSTDVRSGHSDVRGGNSDVRSVNSDVRSVHSDVQSVNSDVLDKVSGIEPLRDSGDEGDDYNINLSDYEADESDCTFVVPKLLNDVSNTFESSVDYTLPDGGTEHGNTGAAQDVEEFVGTRTSGMDMPIVDEGYHLVTDDSMKKRYLQEQDSWLSDTHHKDSYNKVEADGAHDTEPDEEHGAETLDSTVPDYLNHLDAQVDDPKRRQSILSESDDGTRRSEKGEEQDHHDESQLETPNMSHLSAYDNDNDMNPRTGHNLSWTPEEPIVIQHAVSSPSSSLHLHNSSTTTDLEGMDEPALTVQTDMIYDTIEDDRHPHESKHTYSVHSGQSNDTPVNLSGPTTAPTHAPTHTDEAIAVSSRPGITVPNFFISTENLSKTIKLPTTLLPHLPKSDLPKHSDDESVHSQTSSKSSTASETRSKLTSKPSSEQTQRIAKIFATRFSSK